VIHPDGVVICVVGEILSEVQFHIAVNPGLLEALRAAAKGSIVKTASTTGRSLRDVAREAGVEESVLDAALDYHRMAKPHGG